MCDWVLTEENSESEFKKQIRQRLHWTRGTVMHFAKETRIVTEEDFDVFYRILEDFQKAFPRMKKRKLLCDGGEVEYICYDTNEVNIFKKKWFGSVDAT